MQPSLAAALLLLAPLGLLRPQGRGVDPSQADQHLGALGLRKQARS